MSNDCISLNAMKSSPCTIESTNHAAWWNLCAATRSAVKPIFTMACIKCSWSNSAARRVPCNVFSSTATRPLARRPLLSGVYPKVFLIQQCVVENYRHIVETALSASPTPAQRHPFVCPMPSAWLQVWISQRPIRPRVACSRRYDHKTQKCLPNCLVPRHSLVHSKLSQNITLFLATFVYELTIHPSALRCP